MCNSDLYKVVDNEKCLVHSMILRNQDFETAML